MNAYLKIKDSVRNLFSQWKINKDSKLLVAVSGGGDSVLITRILLDLGYRIAIAHCNYQLRGEESDKEEEFVKDFATSHNIPAHYIRFDTKANLNNSADSVQILARKLRYDFFERLLYSEKYDYCITAHHLSDQTETLLFSFLKGFSPEIIKGIPSQRGKFIRPLIESSRNEIEGALAEINQSFCTDSSNLKSDYHRNKIRNQILPVIKEINPSIEQTLQRKINHYHLQIKLIEAVLARFTEEVAILKFEPFISIYGIALLPLLIQIFAQKHNIHGNLLTEVMALGNSEIGKFVVLPENKKIIRSREGLEIINILEGFEAITIPFFEGEKRIQIGYYKVIFIHPYKENLDFKSKNVFHIDSEKIFFPLTIRPKKTGDMMPPFGMKGRKKISDIITDEKFSPFEKENALIFEDKKAEIFALSGYRISRKVAITPKTTLVLKIIITM